MVKKFHRTMGCYQYLAPKGLLSAFLVIVISTGEAQVPDYDLDSWQDSLFVNRAGSFFKSLALQFPQSQPAPLNKNHPGNIGVSLSSSADFSSYRQKDEQGKGEMRLISGRGGILPVFRANSWVTTNLSLVGHFSGIQSQHDLVIFMGYGFDLTLGPPEAGRWFFSFQRNLLEGMDDFFLRTVGIRITRGINYSSGDASPKNHQWFGFGLVSYKAGIHVKSGHPDLTLPSKQEGQMGFLLMGFSRTFQSLVRMHLELRVNSSFFGVQFDMDRGFL